MIQPPEIGVSRQSFACEWRGSMILLAEEADQAALGFPLGFMTRDRMNSGLPSDVKPTAMAIMMTRARPARIRIFFIPLMVWRSKPKLVSILELTLSTELRFAYNRRHFGVSLGMGVKILRLFLRGTLTILP